MARYGRDYGMMDRGNRNFGGSGRTYDMDYNAGYRGDMDRNRGFLQGGSNDRFDNDRGGFGFSGFGNRDRMENRDFGYGNRGGYDRDLGRGDRMTFRTQGRGYDQGFRGGYGRQDRDLGDRLRSGWNDLKEGARDMMGSDRNRGYRGR